MSECTYHKKLACSLERFKSYETNINGHTVSESMVLIILGVNTIKTPTNCTWALAPLAVWLLSAVAMGKRQTGVSVLQCMSACHMSRVSEITPPHHPPAQLFSVCFLMIFTSPFYPLTHLVHCHRSLSAVPLASASCKNRITGS